jgi:hypothetical protein
MCIAMWFYGRVDWSMIQGTYTPPQGAAPALASFVAPMSSRGDGQSRMLETWLTHRRMRLYRQAGWTCAHATRPKNRPSWLPLGFPCPTSGLSPEAGALCSTRAKVQAECVERCRFWMADWTDAVRQGPYDVACELWIDRQVEREGLQAAEAIASCFCSAPRKRACRLNC